MTQRITTPWEIKRCGAFITAIGPLKADEYLGFYLLEVLEKDARLIAAAPDLLEALKDAAEALEHLQNKLAIRVNPPTLEKARAAIAKATGEAT